METTLVSETTLTQLLKDDASYVVGCLRRDGGLPEADTKHNDRQRAIIAAYIAEHGGVAWVGKINIYGEEAGEVIWSVTTADIYNFGASFIVPGYDAELSRLITERHYADYGGTRRDGERVDAIMARIDTLGGYHLLWT